MRWLTQWILVISSILLATSCMSSSPERVSEEFIERYYVQADLKKALELASGLAAEKITQEITLGGGEATAAAMAGRTVTYSRQDPGLASDLQGEKRREIFYALDVRVGSQPPMQRLVRITLEEHDRRWKVVNFAETNR